MINWSCMSNQYVEFNGNKYTLWGNSKTNNYFYSNKTKKYLHRAVWEFHHGKINYGYHIHHIDGNRSNNNIENLECVSPLQHSRIHFNEKKKEYFLFVKIVVKILSKFFQERDYVLKPARQT